MYETAKRNGVKVTIYENKMLKTGALFTIGMVLLLSILAGVIQLQKEAGDKQKQKPIIVQGPMPIEAQKFAKN